MAPLFAAITPLIAIDVGLPVVFWQNRPGRFGRPFKFYKFRTMRAPHDEQGNRIPDQHRVSKLGALLRLSRLDELPQLYNILVGEMSFVGPRPLLITDHEPGTQDRLACAPGANGLGAGEWRPQACSRRQGRSRHLVRRASLSSSRFQDCAAHPAASLFRRANQSGGGARAHAGIVRRMSLRVRPGPGCARPKQRRRRNRRLTVAAELCERLLT